jgi:hypothetical protein
VAPYGLCHDVVIACLRLSPCKASELFVTPTPISEIRSACRRGITPSNAASGDSAVHESFESVQPFAYCISSRWSAKTRYGTDAQRKLRCHGLCPSAWNLGICIGEKKEVGLCDFDRRAKGIFLRP